MPRYFIKPPAAEWWDQTLPALSHPLVYPSEPVKTGLLNSDGVDIYRGPDPIGFVPPKSNLEKEGQRNV